jgi:predicted alternative tryptophan synthase beta-subunit
MYSCLQSVFQSRTQQERKRAEAKLIARQKKKQAKLLASGIQYDFADVAYVRPIILLPLQQLASFTSDFCYIET